ncbi:DUF3849 domain-containing protein [Anaerotignum sp. MB30-C6]|uniref:DUF3849 domain-containing protein n=1 Tax=Anaerotignum sp. MB30-C6 TaxID=3070814 RepID=UPI0027DBD8A8|nr:DUF3849 domain-containing protein [Anaerotignum sp. MB30-C6]WMI82406.1 DUF3849 domain-containing protein [Anaerotignum sp. MB30-C6]
MDKNYVYPYSFQFAKENQELDLYKESHKANVECRNAIEEAIAQNFDGLRLGKNTAEQIISEFGYDRVNFVLANSVQQKSHDGRFSCENKEWAKEFYISSDKVQGFDKRLEFAVDSHPAVLDGFINQARRAYQSLSLWESKHCNNPTGLNFEGKVMVLHPTNLKDEYKNPRDQLVLCEDGFGCSPTASGRKVFGRFLSDGERCQYDRSDFIGELKTEHLPDWALKKLNEMGVNMEENQDMGGIKMQ